jgi:release factor glutamine methyltransferase
VRDYEPTGALDGGLDGLSVHRRILGESPKWLVPGAQVLLEIAFDQGELAKQIAAEQPDFTDVRIIKDLAGNDRVLALKRA